MGWIILACAFGAWTALFWRYYLRDKYLFKMLSECRDGIDVTRKVAAIYKAAWGEEFPDDWKAFLIHDWQAYHCVVPTCLSHMVPDKKAHYWYNMAALGCTYFWVKRIFVTSQIFITEGMGVPKGSGPEGCILHELVHMKNPTMRHGDEFDNEVRSRYLQWIANGRPKFV